MKGILFLLFACAAARADCTKATQGNITVQRCTANSDGGDPQWHFFVTSSDPATRGFRLTVVAANGPGNTDPLQSYTVSQTMARPNATVHFLCQVMYTTDFSAPGPQQPPYPAPLVSIKIDELQPANSATFSAADGSLP
jgi:hypothetical protein